MRWSSLPHSLLVVLVPLLLSTLITVDAAATAAPPPRETYAESLRLTPLRDGKLHSHFNFTFVAPNYSQMGSSLGPNSIAHHHTLLPPELTALIHHYRVASFDLTLSSGRWHSSWPTSSTAVSGIELVAWLELLDGESLAEEQQRWSDFKNALAGLFCTGLTNGVSSSESSPRWAHALGGGLPEEEHRLYRTTVPRLAATCTESLTPFLSLLPCASYAGLSSLLNPHRLFDGDWTLLGVHVLRDNEIHSIRLEVGSVADPVRRDRLQGYLGRRDFSFESLYSRKLERSCAVAHESFVQVVVPSDSMNPFRIEPRDGQSIIKIDGADVVQWDAKNIGKEPLNVDVNWPNDSVFQYPHPTRALLPPFITRRLLHGHGQERGKIGVELINNLDQSVEVLWIETWPWWLRAFISTLSASSDPEPVSEEIIRSIDYTPPIARSRPTTLQALVVLPARSMTRLMLSYESSYLWYTEYPSDAHRGFEILGATLILLHPPPTNSSVPIGTISGHEALRSRGERMRLHTSSTLLSLPTPDFSMPYNVIILTSTIVALFFGSVMNRLVRGWRVVALEEEAEVEENKVDVKI